MSHLANAGTAIEPNNIHRWLWVPAFAGTTNGQGSQLHTVRSRRDDQRHTLQLSTFPPPPSYGPPWAVVRYSRRHPRDTGRQPPRSHTIWPDACGFAVLASGRGRSRTGRSGRASGSRLAAGVFARRFSHSLSSLRNEPSAQTILLQRSPSALKPCSQTSGQTRDGFTLIASSASVLASLTSNLVPAWRLNSASERCEAVFHSPSAAPVRQPTRRSSVCTDFVISACGGPALSEATFVVFSAFAFSHVHQ